MVVRNRQTFPDPDTSTSVYSTSTGTGVGVALGSIGLVTMQVVQTTTGTFTISVQGTVDGDRWTEVIAASTDAGGSTHLLVSSTLPHACNQYRAVITATASTGGVNVSLFGR